MRYPEFQTRSRDTLMQSYFGGYNARERISDSEFSDEQNLSSRAYPLLAPRAVRSQHVGVKVGTPFLGAFSAHTPYGEMYVVAKGRKGIQTQLFVIDAEGHYNGTIYGIDDYTGTRKQFVTMGADVIMFPDKLKLSFGSDRKYQITREKLENVTVTTASLPDGWEGDVGFWYVDPAKVTDGDNDGIDVKEDTWYTDEPPENPTNGQWWQDKSNAMNDPYGKSVGVIRRYSAAQGTWVDIYPTFVKIRMPGIGKGFKAGDYVKISQTEYVGGAIRALMGERYIELCGDDYIVVSGSVVNTEHSAVMIPAYAGIKVERSVPDLDFITEAGNRLWGCRNAVVDGKTINEIYVSALGDPTNWSKYEGIASDSYAVTIGAGGAFTGAATYSDVPHFFKEDCIIKVYGNAPINYETVCVRCDGVESGCADSIAVVDGRLFYKARRGIMLYDGSYPSHVSAELGDERYTEAVGGALYGRYYVSMTNGNGERKIFVYDTETGLWHVEEGEAESFISTTKKLIMLTRDFNTYVINPDGEETERSVKWYAVTGDIGLDDPDRKYISRIRIRARVPIGARFEVSLAYNGSEVFEDVAHYEGTGMGTLFYLIHPVRHDTLKMRLSGEGDVRVYSIAYECERGSDA